MDLIDINKTNALMHDKSFRQALINNPDANAGKLGCIKEQGSEFKVVENTNSTFYFVIPEDASELSNSGLASINAAGAFTISTAGSVGSICTTASTAGTAGTAVVVNGKTY